MENRPTGPQGLATDKEETLKEDTVEPKKLSPRMLRLQEIEKLFVQADNLTLAIVYEVAEELGAPLCHFKDAREQAQKWLELKLGELEDRSNLQMILAERVLQSYQGDIQALYKEVTDPASPQCMLETDPDKLAIQILMIAAASVTAQGISFKIQEGKMDDIISRLSNQSAEEMKALMSDPTGPLAELLQTLRR